MARRKLASILIRDGWTCVKGAGVTFPLWKPEAHLNYMLSSGCSDLIVASDDPRMLFALDTQCHINMIAALGWSGVKEIRNLFEAGYSKIFFGGSVRQFPNPEEAEIFAEMVHIYGASSFGYSMHFSDVMPILEPIFLAQFNEIYLIPNKLQLCIDEEVVVKLASMFEGVVGKDTHELNLCGPSANYQAWSASSCYPINYVNYCEHAIARLR